ncbi:MAG: methyltransferase domain-containing protein [Methanosarcinales archaeon]|nr:methyltransferase domain-containing protein [Methanosarcinales archaeon]
MYKWNAKEYANFSAEQQKWAEELLSKLALKGNERVLDIGCGDGKITAGIAQLLPEGSVLGIDNSKEMIRFAKENFPLEQFTNLTFELEDARTLSYPLLWSPGSENVKHFLFIGYT